MDERERSVCVESEEEDLLRVGGRADETVEEEEGGEVGVISIKGSRSIEQIGKGESVSYNQGQVCLLIQPIEKRGRADSSLSTTSH